MKPKRTLVLVKWEAIDFSEDILKKFDEIGKRVLQIAIPSVKKEWIADHYANLRDKPFYSAMIQDHVGKPIILVIYESKNNENIIEKIHSLLGETDPEHAAEGTIRKMFIQKAKYPIKEKLPNDSYIIRDFAHAADSQKEFEREAKVWEKALNVSLTN